jgi:hypothetical protein
MLVTQTKEYYVNTTPGACTIKHYGFVIYGFSSKLASKLKLVFATDKRKAKS